MKIELLLVEEHNDYFEVKDITYLDALSLDSRYKTLKASFVTIEAAKNFLRCGKTVKVPKNFEFAEVRPCDLIIEENDQIELHKRIAMNEVLVRMHQNILGVCVIDMMDYLDSYMKLMAGGIFITDSNREDKYFEIIEKAQSVEEPQPLNENSSFEEEQNFIKDKQEYDLAQSNLSTLEKYLNAYDKLSKIRYVNDLLNNAKDKIESLETIKDIDIEVEKYKSELNSNFYNSK